jgi:pimeloyl-ACP methyl ester carboxylesterase
VNGPSEFLAEVNGEPCRVWEQGDGPAVGYFAGFGGLPRWTPFLERLATGRRVVAPSLPGFPGGLGHLKLDSQLDWILAARDLLVEADLDGAALVGTSVGGALAAEVAALWPDAVSRLVLIAPLGLYEVDEPPADPFAQRPGTHNALFCRSPANYDALLAAPNDVDENEWQVLMIRAQEAAARLLWPLGETGLRKRLARIECPTLLLWGRDDALLPLSYAERFAEAISGPVEIATIPQAGHLAELDAPEATAKRIAQFLDAA